MTSPDRAVDRATERPTDQVARDRLHAVTRTRPTAAVPARTPLLLLNAAVAEASGPSGDAGTAEDSAASLRRARHRRGVGTETGWVSDAPHDATGRLLRDATRHSTGDPTRDPAIDATRDPSGDSTRDPTTELTGDVRAGRWAGADPPRGSAVRWLPVRPDAAPDLTSRPDPAARPAAPTLRLVDQRADAAASGDVRERETGFERDVPDVPGVTDMPDEPDMPDVPGAQRGRGDQDGPSGRGRPDAAGDGPPHRWAGEVPTVPGPGADAEAVDHDAHDVRERSRAEALAAAAAGYTRSYGHPLDHPHDQPGEEKPASGRRWWLSARHAVVAGVAVVVLAAGVVIRASADVPDPPVEIGSAEVQAGAVAEGAAAGGGQPAVADGDARAGTTGTTGTTGATGAAAGPADPGGAASAGAGAGPSATSGSGAASAPGSAAGVASGGPGTVAGPVVVVHVVGQVAVPGVLELPAGSRVGDAVAAAGGAGPEADLSAVNLARVVVDGEQVHVPAHGEAVRPDPSGAPTSTPSGAVGGTTGAGGAATPVPLNTADVAALDALPGIGPVLAQRILEWRTANGPFRSVDELGEVSGIGEALLAKLRPLVTV